MARRRARASCAASGRVALAVWRAVRLVGRSLVGSRLAGQRRRALDFLANCAAHPRRGVAGIVLSLSLSFRLLSHPSCDVPYQVLLLTSDLCSRPSAVPFVSPLLLDRVGSLLFLERFLSVVSSVALIPLRASFFALLFDGGLSSVHSVLCSCLLRSFRLLGYFLAFSLFLPLLFFANGVMVFARQACGGSPPSS